MTSRLIRVGIASAALVLTLSLPILGCQTWPGEIPICHQYKSNRAIFIGKVLSIEPVPRNVEGLTEMAKAWVPQFNRVEFAVIEPFKTDGKETVKMLALSKEMTSCDKVYRLKVGEKWLIFSDNAVDGERVVSIAEPAGSSYRVEALRKISHRPIVPAIHGQFLIARKDIKGIGLIAESSNRKYLATMDQYGQFKFDPVEPGTYRLRILFPFAGYVADRSVKSWFRFDSGAGVHWFDFDVTVEEGDCFYEKFTVGTEDSFEIVGGYTPAR